MIELKPCPCGKTPTGLIIESTNAKWFRCSGICCGEWEIEFRSNYNNPNPDSDEAEKLAIKAWNDAPRGDK